MLYPIAKLICMFFFSLGVIPIVVEGRENLKGLRPFIVASNHTDGSDGAVVLWCLPFFFWLGLRDDYGQPIRFFLTWLLKTTLLNRERIKPSQYRKLKRILESGESILLFPQGTRSKVLTKKAKPGIGLLSYKTQVPVLPISITGTEGLLRKTFIWQILRAILRLRPPIKVVIHEPMICQNGRDDQEFTDKVMVAIASGLHPEQRGYYATKPA